MVRKCALCHRDLKPGSTKQYHDHCLKGLKRLRRRMKLKGEAESEVKYRVTEMMEDIEWLIQQPVRVQAEELGARAPTVLMDVLVRLRSLT